MVHQATSWLKDNSPLALFLGAQLIALGAAAATIIAYSVRLETRVSIMETRGALYTVERLTGIEHRLTVLEQQIAKNSASIERVIDVMTRELKK